MVIILYKHIYLLNENKKIENKNDRVKKVMLSCVNICVL